MFRVEDNGLEYIYIYIVSNILSLYEHARNLFVALIFGLNQPRCTETFNKRVLSSIKLSLEEKNPLRFFSILLSS